MTYMAFMSEILRKYLGYGVGWVDLIDDREDVDAETIISRVIDGAGLEVVE